MVEQPRLTRQQAIEELRREARELEQKPCSLREYARNVYKARIRRDLADKLERHEPLEPASSNDADRRETPASD